MVRSPTNAIDNQQLAVSSPSRVDDRVLVERACGGDDAALRALIDRYDRLVRFAVFRLGRDRCRKDPAWLETVAADTWVGFIRSVRRTGETPDTPVAYLLRIARNKAVSALRAGLRTALVVEADLGAALETQGADADPAELASGLEDLVALRGCVDTLGAEDRQLATQLSAILDRRWQDAAQALSLPESTVRSRWKRTLDRLRACLEGKTGKNFAPTGRDDDE